MGRRVISNSGLPGGEPRSERARLGMLALLTLLVVVASLVWSGAAYALSQRGHVLSATTLGTPGEGDGQLDEPGELAVNETTGNVYVADRGNHRIEEFGPTGEFIAVWGYGVSDGAQTFEVCSSKCKPGTGKGALGTLGAIAVDNSTGPSRGDVYVVMDTRLNSGALWKFTAEGVKIKALKEEGEDAKWEGALDGVSVDASGDLWVYRSGEEPTEGFVEGFDGKEEVGKEEGEKGNEYRYIQLEPELESEALLNAKETAGYLCPKQGFAVDASAEHVYVDHERVNSEGAGECPEQRIAEEHAELKQKAAPVELLRPVVPAKFLYKPSEEVIEGQIGALSSQYTRSIAVDLASSASTPMGDVGKGEVYLASGATMTSVDTAGEAIQRITLPGSSPIASGVATNSQDGDVFVADASGGTVDVLTPAPAAAPSVDSVYPQAVSPTSTKVFARIDPRGLEAHASLIYGTEDCAANLSACTEVPLSPADLGSGFGDVTAEVELMGLTPNTRYYYSVVAHNTSGTSQSSENFATFFTTLPSAQGLLADHREWEMVSPPAKPGPLEMPSDTEPAALQSAVDGDAFTFGAVSTAAFGEATGNRGKQPSQLFFTRSAEGWSMQNIATPHNTGEGSTPGEWPEYIAFSPELSLSLLWPEARVKFPIEEPPLSPPLSEAENGHQEKTLYLRPNPPVQPQPTEAAAYNEAAANSGYLAPGYLSLITQVNDTAGNPFGSALGEEGEGFVGASENLQHVVVSSPVGLTSGVTQKGLYEWSSNSPAHALQFVSTTSSAGEPPAINPKLGSFGDTRRAISEDGSRIFFSSQDATETNDGAHLYMRDTATHETVKINAVQGAGHNEPTPVDEESPVADVATYQTASADGSRVFFTDTWPLTEESRLAPTEYNYPADLYEYNVETKKLTDLTVDEHNGQSADVLGTIPGASEDGSDVYFVANGALTPGATPGDCREAPSAEVSSASCNLYVSEPSPQNPAQRETKLIARLSNNDALDWNRGGRSPEGNFREDLTFLTSRVSANGRYLAFMSERSLTGYDNEDATSKVSGERMDEEVFVYDAQLGRLVCASCNPDSSKRPTGVFDTEYAGEGVGLLADRSNLWKNRWLAGSIPGWTALVEGHSAARQPAYLSNSGRLFFNSADSLVSQDTNTRLETIDGNQERVGVEDVYEYEPEGVGSCTTAPGCVALASSGTDEHESALLSASESGGDVFFLTTAKLLGQDIDSAYDIYDARICGTSESGACLAPYVPPAPECAGETCKAAVPATTSFGQGSTSTFSGPGNTPSNGVLPSKTVVKPSAPKKLTRPQLLAKALKSCKKMKKKSKRVACEKRAKKKYGAKKKAKKASSSVRTAR